MNDPRVGGSDVSPSGEWSDDDPPATKPFAYWREVELFWRMRKTVLTAVVWMFLATLAVVTAGSAMHWFTEDLAGRLLDIALPVLLSAVVAIVATLFTDSSRK